MHKMVLFFTEPVAALARARGARGALRKYAMRPIYASPCFEVR